jgi:protein-tyrosine phosphatase
VPGVDDGAESLESALGALRAFRDSGVRRVVTTPHLDAGHVRTSRRRRIETAFEALAAAAAESVPGVRLELSYEIRIDDPEVDLSDRGIGLADGGSLLVEFPRLALPAYSGRMLEVVQNRGWRAVLAHPERYAGIGTSYEWIGRWREMGVLLCLNVGSLLGEHGREAQDVARRMLASGHADLMGSDHHARPRRSTLLRRGRDFLAEQDDPRFAEAAALLTDRNPEAVLEGEPLTPVPPLDVPSGWLSRMRRRLLGR